MRVVKRLFWLSLLAGTISACGGGGGGGGGNTSSQTNNIQLSGLVVNVSDADVVSTADQTSAPSDDASSAAQSSSALQSVRTLSNTEPGAGASNLWAFDDNGQATLALTADLPVQVRFAVKQPDTDNLFIALDSVVSDELVASNNCALYQVAISDNTIACAVEGITPVDVSDEFFQAVGNGQKPLQFDDAGHIYFSGYRFERICDEQEPDICWTDENINSQVFRFQSGNADVTELTAVEDDVYQFLVLKEGKLVYHFFDEDSEWQERLVLLDPATNQQQLLNSAEWGIEFFAIDDYRTILWGDWSDGGMRMATPSSDGDVHKVTLSTELFGKDAFPLQYILGDDGNLYTAMQTGFWLQEEQKWQNRLSVYQSLPADLSPKVVLDLPDEGWWQLMDETPFQVAGGYLIYRDSLKSVQTSQGVDLGATDIIRLVRLEDRKPITLLDQASWSSDSPRYRIENWRMQDKWLYFTALDKVADTMVVGKVDTSKISDEVAQSEFLTLTESTAEWDSAASIRDLEVLADNDSSEPAPSVDPVVESINVMSENLFSASMEFSTPMDFASVEDNLQFINQDTGTNVPSMKLWFGSKLHLVPDLDGLTNTTTSHLDYSMNYAVGVNNSGTEPVVSITGEALDVTSAHPASADFDTRIEQGWFVGASAIHFAENTDGYVAKLVNLPESWDAIVSDVLNGSGGALDIPTNFELEFNAEIANGLVLTFVDSQDPSYELIYLDLGASIQFLSYQDLLGHSYLEQEDPGVANGHWQRYRLRHENNEFTVEFASQQQDGQWQWQWRTLYSVDDMGLEEATLRLRIRAFRDIALDNIQLRDLSGSSLLDASFTSASNINDTFQLLAVESE